MGTSGMIGNVQTSGCRDITVDDLAVLGPNLVTEAALVRKIDWRIVPTLFLAYFLQFLDKVAINYANVMGLQKDLHMRNQDFAWTAGAFFVGYIVAQWPQGVLLRHFPAPKVLGYNILLWGIILCFSAACRDKISIIALRTLLGMCEAAIAPTLIVTTSRWYIDAEAPLRYGIWYCGLGAGQILGGLISFCVQHSRSTFAGWRVMFICIGIVNILVAILILFTLPDGPGEAKFLDQDEKKLVRERLGRDNPGTKPAGFDLRLLREVLSDTQTWLLVLLTACITIPSGVISTFSAVLIHSFGYDSKQSALLNMPSGVVSIFATILATWAVLKHIPRWLSIIGLLIPAIIGATLLSFEGPSRPAGSLAGIYLVNFIVPPLALIYNWVGTNYDGHTMIIAGNVVSCTFGIANIIGPQTYQAKDAPGYFPAKITLLGVITASIAISIALYKLYTHRNRMRVSEGSTYGL